MQLKKWDTPRNEYKDQKRQNLYIYTHPPPLRQTQRNMENRV